MAPFHFCEFELSAADSALVPALQTARQHYRLARVRGELLGDGLFADPAWNMLLDLFISSAEGRRLSVSALCIGSRAPAATAHRYVQLLADAGLVERSADEKDGRRRFIALTDEGHDAMVTLLTSLG